MQDSMGRPGCEAWMRSSAGGVGHPALLHPVTSHASHISTGAKWWIDPPSGGGGITKLEEIYYDARNAADDPKRYFRLEQINHRFSIY